MTEENLGAPDDQGTGLSSVCPCWLLKDPVTMEGPNGKRLIKDSAVSRSGGSTGTWVPDDVALRDRRGYGFLINTGIPLWEVSPYLDRGLKAPSALWLGVIKKGGLPEETAFSPGL